MKDHSPVKRTILSAILTMVRENSTEIGSNTATERGNSIQQVGAGLERYLKDAFADTFGIDDVERQQQYDKIFSHQGSANNPPDFMLRGGDAVEVKKKNSAGGSIPLNSSYPKQKLFASSSMITEACRNCEAWDVKDLVYAIGHVEGKTLKTLWLVYGDCYAAKPDTYESLANTIRRSVRESGLELGKTNELARVNQVDPPGKTSLRVRGMWQIEHPSKFFSYIEKLEQNKSATFTLNAIMRKEKYESFSIVERKLFEGSTLANLTIMDAKILSPDNPAEQIDAIIIRYSV